MDYKDEPCNDECGTKKSILTQKKSKNLILRNSGGGISIIVDVRVVHFSDKEMF